MMYKRYEGQFWSIDGVTWTVSIYQQANAAFASIGELDFPAPQSNILSIEWAETSKEEVMCGSTAHLTLISPGDRTYLDLYTEVPGAVRMDVSRNGSLYWSGCLDPEFYEEPYNSGANYEVSFTFTDFGILNRLKYNLTGMVALDAILADALSRSGINYTAIDQSLISTLYNGVTDMRLSHLAVRSDNFTDEDGEASTLYDVLSGMLQPLAIRMVQKAGKIWLYDINGLYAASAGSIIWSGTDQVLSTDKVANNVKISFSAYGGDGKLTEDIEFTDPVDKTLVNLTTADVTPDRFSFYQNMEQSSEDPLYTWDSDWLGFTIFLSQNGNGLASKLAAAKYFHIAPLLGGEEAEGLAYWFRVGPYPLTQVGSARKCSLTNVTYDTVLCTTPRHFIPQLGIDEASAHKLRLVLPLLIDTRYNPFSDAEVGNEADNYATLQGVNDAMIYVKVQLYDAEGNVLYHYANKQTTGTVGYDSEHGKVTIHSTIGRWVSGAASYDDCALQYYDPKNKYDGEALQGWKNNRQACGMLCDYIYPSFSDMDDGQYMPYPPCGGYVEVSVCAGVLMYNEDSLSYHTDLSPTLLPLLRWFLLKAPELTIVKGIIARGDVGTDDVEYSGRLNDNAKDPLELDTICGTMTSPSPLAKGQYFASSTSYPLRTLTRAGRTASPEQLLIGTLYSQFASRKAKLSGTAGIMAEAVKPYTEAHQGNKRFMVLSEYQYPGMSESEITAVEIAPDEYVEQ